MTNGLNKYLLVCYFFLALPCLSQENSHKKILFQLSDAAVQKIIKNNDWSLDSNVNLFLRDNAQSNFFLQQIIQSITSEKKQVFLNNSSYDTVLNVSVREMTLHYGEVFSETFFGSRKVVRNIVVSLDVETMITSIGKVINSKNIVAASIDTINYSLVEKFNDPSIPFSNIVSPQLSFFDSILEPAIVTIASGVVIYLFFTIRS